MYINYQHRIFGLDVIRTIAILLVLISHSTLLLFPENNHISITAIRFFGTIGVDLFFVLSGYLIGGLLLRQIRNGKTAFKNFMYFWIRRWFRTLPNYILILAFNVLLYYVLYHVVIDDIGYFIVFLQNFAVPHPNFFTEAWSLSVEEYAYIIGPLILYILLLFRKNNSKEKLYIVMVFIIILAITYFRIRYHNNHGLESFETWSHSIRKVVIYRIDSIYYGFIGAYVAVNYTSVWQNYKKRFFNIGMLIFIVTHTFIFAYDAQPNDFPLFYNIFYLPLISISLLLLFPVFSNWKTGNFLKKQITSTSILSYGIYLINYSLILLTIQYFIDVESVPVFMKLILLLVYWVVTFYVSYLLYRYFEKPMTDLRDSKFIKEKFNKT